MKLEHASVRVTHNGLLLTASVQPAYQPQPPQAAQPYPGTFSASPDTEGRFAASPDAEPGRPWPAGETTGPAPQTAMPPVDSVAAGHMSALTAARLKALIILLGSLFGVQMDEVSLTAK